MNVRCSLKDSTASTIAKWYCFYSLVNSNQPLVRMASPNAAQRAKDFSQYTSRIAFES